MDLRLGREKIYAIIAVFVVILIFITFLLSSNELFQAYVDDKVLTDGWYEDGQGYNDSRLFGLEKQVSFDYKIDNNSFPAYLTVSSFKTLFMINENDLIQKTDDIIKDSMKKRNITIDKDSLIKDTRVLKNGHKTNYILYNATKKINGFSEEIKIIGEAWNCEKSGGSIIAIGYAQVTNNSLYFPEKKYVIDFTHWSKIIRDPANTFSFFLNNLDKMFLGEDGLIFNIICH